MSRSITRISILISLSLSLTACATYQPSEAECFNSFAEVARSNCSFELLHTVGPVVNGNG